MQNNNEIKAPIMNTNLEKIGKQLVESLKKEQKQVTIIDESTHGLASGAITGISGSSGVFEFAYINLGTNVKTALKESQADYYIKLSNKGNKQVISIIPKGEYKEGDKTKLEYNFDGNQKEIDEKIVCTALACLDYKVTNPEKSLEETKQAYKQIAEEQNQVQYTSYSFENQKAEEVKALLKQEGLTLSTVESITCGLAGRALGAEKTYGTYSNHAKNVHVGVDQMTMDAHHEVSAHTAREMAIGGLKNSKSDICISFTGFAGKAWQESTRFDKEVGFEIPKEKGAREASNKPAPKRIGDAQVCMCIAYRDKGTIKTHIIKDVFADYTDKDNPNFDRHKIRNDVITYAATRLETLVKEIAKGKDMEERSTSIDHKNDKQIDSPLNRIDKDKRDFWKNQTGRKVSGGFGI